MFWWSKLGRFSKHTHTSDPMCRRAGGHTYGKLNPWAVGAAALAGGRPWRRWLIRASRADLSSRVSALQHAAPAASLPACSWAEG